MVCASHTSRGSCVMPMSNVPCSHPFHGFLDRLSPNALSLDGPVHWRRRRGAVGVHRLPDRMYRPTCATLAHAVCSTSLLVGDVIRYSRLRGAAGLFGHAVAPRLQGACFFVTSCICMLCVRCGSCSSVLASFGFRRHGDDQACCGIYSVLMPQCGRVYMSVCACVCSVLWHVTRIRTHQFVVLCCDCRFLYHLQVMFELLLR